MEEEIREERRRLRALRRLVDLVTQIIMQSRLSRWEAEELVEVTRRQILQLFPGQEQTYEIVYRRRFERLIQEFAPGAKVLPFPRSDG